MGLMSISIDGASDATRWTFKQYKSPLSCSRDSWGETLELPLTPHEEQRRQWLHRTLNLMGGRSRTRHAWRTAREDNGRTRDVLLKARREKQKVRHKVTSFFEVKKKKSGASKWKKKKPCHWHCRCLTKDIFWKLATKAQHRKSLFLSQLKLFCISKKSIQNQVRYRLNTLCKHCS